MIPDNRLEMQEKVKSTIKGKYVGKSKEIFINIIIIIIM